MLVGMELVDNQNISEQTFAEVCAYNNIVSVTLFT